jgi:hypothetical protein
MEMIAPGGVLAMLQQYNLLYNQQSLDFRKNFISKWDVREILDFVSVRGLFQKGGADTKVLVIVAESSRPPEDRRILHATFRRSGRVDAEQGFDVDYYDLHWLPRELVLNNDGVWRADLLGGGRALTLIDRLRQFPTLGAFAEKRGWNYGEGFIEGRRRVNRPSDHIVGKALLPSEALTADGIDESQIDVAPKKPIEGPRSAARFTAPLLLIREQMDIPHAVWPRGYLTYKNQIVGFAAPSKDLPVFREIDQWLSREATALAAFVAGVSVKLFTQRSTTLSGADILALPYPEGGTLDLAPNEQIIVDDIVKYQRDVVRLGENSAGMATRAGSALVSFSRVFTKQVNAIYRDTPLRALKPHTWPGITCQPFVFGHGDVDWENAVELGDRLDRLLKERDNRTLSVTRIARIYDDRFIFLLKPDRLRYWLESVALRDADEMLADLRAQGF